MNRQTNISDNTKRLTGIAAFSALAFGASLVTNIPVGFLTFDAKDAVITIASFIYGPISAVFMSFITTLLEFVSIGNTGIYGALMDFVSTLSFTLTASIIYEYKRDLKGALIALGSASTFYTIVMMAANLIITPLYMGVSAAAVKAMIPTMLLPFNVAKAFMNSALVMFLYKPTSRLVRRIGFAKPSESNGTPARRDALIFLSIAGAFFAIAIVIFVLLRK